MTNAPSEDGFFSKIPDAAYHADRDTLSSTGARMLLPPSCPAKFREWADNPPKPKREYDFGHVAHTLLLGEGADIVEVDAPDWRTKDARDARDKAHANDQTPVLSSELRKAHRMVRKVRDHPTAGALFERGHAEVSLYHTDSQTQVRLRGRPDWTTTLDGRLVLVDYKTSTTARPDDFERKAADYGYHMQAAWYLDLAIRLWNPDTAFLFVVQEKEPPHLVTVVEYDAESIAEGRRANREAIRIYAQCRDTNTWPSYPGADQIQPITIPPWAYHTPTINDLLAEQESTQ